MADLILNKQRKDIHFLALGNKPGEELRFHEMAPANVFEYITFGGYRDDIEKIFSSSYAGIIASSGWDSWPMSVIEMGASGLPLLVSRLQGLREFVVDEANGYGFEPGNSTQLAEKIELLVDNPSLADAMSKNNRGKVVEFYSDAAQQAKLADIISDQLL
jgi:glycosyltransferase involved in cell wall biosynthesis